MKDEMKVGAENWMNLGVEVTYFDLPEKVQTLETDIIM